MGCYDDNKNVKDLWNKLTIKDCFLDTDNRNVYRKKLEWTKYILS